MCPDQRVLLVNWLLLYKDVLYTLGKGTFVNKSRGQVRRSLMITPIKS